MRKKIHKEYVSISMSLLLLAKGQIYAIYTSFHKSRIVWISKRKISIRKEGETGFDQRKFHVWFYPLLIPYFSLSLLVCMILSQSYCQPLIPVCHINSVLLSLQFISLPTYKTICLRVLQLSVWQYSRLSVGHQVSRPISQSTTTLERY